MTTHHSSRATKMKNQKHHLANRKKNKAHITKWLISMKTVYDVGGCVLEGLNMDAWVSL